MKRTTMRARAAVAAAALGLWLGGGTAVRGGNTCTWTGSWDTFPANEDDVIVVASGASLTWSNTMPARVASWEQQAAFTNTVTFQTVYGSVGFTNFTVSGDVTLARGTWTHLANVGGETNRLRATIGGNLAIASNAAVSGAGLGYAWTRGPGASSNCGGAHGGATSRKQNVSNGGVFNLKTYGSVVAPVNLGSGGGSADAGNDGAGGGALWLTVAGTTTVATAGNINADGASKAQSGGAGGSVLLQTGWLTGNGAIRANGGSCTWDYASGGSGGRVAIVLTGANADFSSWSGTVTAYGGTTPKNGVKEPGAAGTVYRKTAAGVDTLIIDNNNNVTHAGRVPTLMPGGADAVNLNAFGSVIVTNKGMLGIAGDTTVNFGIFAPLTYGPANSGIIVHNDANATYPANWVIGGYTLYANNALGTNRLVNLTIATNGVLSHYQNFSADSYKLDLTLPGNLTVRSNGLINANGVGRWVGNGPGYSTDFGSAHGGTACKYRWTGGVTAVNRKTYGSVLAPTNAGSAGNVANGGGIVFLNVAGTTTVDAGGAITAGGGEPSNYGASGGSIYLRTGWLSGGGAIRANGGRSDWDVGAGGGGGRVSVVLTAAGAGFGTWTGALTAYGGLANNVSPNAPAAAGTVYRQAQAEAAGAGTVIADNRSSATNASYTSLPAFAAAKEDLSQTVWVSTNRARLALVTNTVARGLVLHANGALELAGYTLTVQTMTVTNRVYKNGTYTPAEINALTDAVGGGKVVVFTPLGGTLIIVK